MEIDGGYDLFVPEAPNYFLIVHACYFITKAVCVRQARL